MVIRRAPSTAPHDHGRAGARHRPAEIGRDFDVLHLSAAAFAVVMGMPALAVCSDGTGVVRIMAELAHILDHHVDAVGIALAEVAAAGVVGPPSAQPNGAVADIVAALALFAEAVVFE